MGMNGKLSNVEPLEALLFDGMGGWHVFQKKFQDVTYEATEQHPQACSTNRSNRFFHGWPQALRDSTPQHIQAG